MGETNSYKISLDELVASARVAPEDMVESVDVDAESTADPRGLEPDIRWFAAGG